MLHMLKTGISLFLFLRLDYPYHKILKMGIFLYKPNISKK